MVKTYWVTADAPAFKKRTRIHCITCHIFARYVLKQEPSIKTLWHDTEDDGSPTKSIAHFAIPKQISQLASPSHLKIKKLQDYFAPLELVLSTKLQNYRNEMLKIH